MVFLGALVYFVLVKGPREYVVPIDAPETEPEPEPDSDVSQVDVPASRAEARQGRRGHIKSSARNASARTSGPAYFRPWPPMQPATADEATGRPRGGDGGTPAASAAQLEPTSTDPRPRREAGDVRTAVVVGAGMAGLATAGALARAGWQVTAPGTRRAGGRRRRPPWCSGRTAGAPWSR